jgi:hypothetical protein
MTEKIVGAIKISYAGSNLTYSLSGWPTSRSKPPFGDGARAAFSGITLPRTGHLHSEERV